jgi:NDP-sugar pyrophosphorylase family protein
MKKRVTLTIESDILSKLDKRVDGVNVRNRSHIIEMMLDRQLRSEGVKHAVILCGGRGTRLQPITYEIPKTLIPVQGRPIIDHLFDLLKRHNIRDVTLSVGHMKEKIKEEIGDGFGFGMNVRYNEENEAMGTAGAIRLLKENSMLPREPFIVSNGDELKDIDIESMLRAHKSSNALATIALTAVENPSDYGVARLNGNQILEFVEKPSAEEAPSNFINAGFYILEPEVADMIPQGFAMLEKDVFPALAKMGKLHGFAFSGQWFDTGNMERYERALREWAGLRK